jgi:tetratricopeptide (TPR) repeat protein
VTGTLTLEGGGGYIRSLGPTAVPGARGHVAVTGDRYQGHLFNPADLAEPVDLDPDRRKQILFAEASLASWSHWDALGLEWNAPPEAVKAAYLEQVKVFHPDRYAGKKLGSFRARLEKVFRRITEARDVLSDEARRRDYVKASAPALEVTRMEARKLEDERRAEERRGRLARQNPLLARAGKISDLLKRGKEHLAAGRFVQAAADFQLVAGLDPSLAEVAGLIAEARKQGAAAKVAECLEKGAEAETMGQWHRALAAYRLALEADPNHFRASVLASRAGLKAGEVGAARELGELAVRLAPRNAAAHEALGLALAAMGRKAEAKKALERAVELDARLETAREHLKKLRWSFLG